VCSCQPYDVNDKGDIKKILSNSIDRLQAWIEKHDYMAYEPFDGLSSPLRKLTFGNLLMQRLLLQLVRQSPYNLRPLLGIKPLPSTKGRGYMAAGYLTRWKTTSDLEYRDKAVNCLEWLMRYKSPKYEDYSWANHFAFAGRTGSYEKHESIIVWTAIIAHAFLDAYVLLGESKYLDVARSACNWIMHLPRERTKSGSCISYYAIGISSIHNSNMLGASILARAAKYTGESSWQNVAREAMEYSCSRQRPDGSWFYGEASNQHWIDNFHTGYNLDSLKCYMESTGDRTYETHLKRGLAFYKNHFFEESGRPRYYHTRTYPVDSQCIAQAIETLSNFAIEDQAFLNLAERVAMWAIDNMQDEKGYFYYRQYPLNIKAKTPMLHWAQTTTYKGLALLLFRLL